MARQLKYPIRKYLRISEESQTKLNKKVKKMGLPENVVLRIIIERGLENDQTLTPSQETK